MKLDEKEIGKYYTNGKGVWRLIIYTDHPTATFENLDTKQRVGGVVGSPIVHEFKELVEKKEGEI